LPDCLPSNPESSIHLNRHLALSSHCQRFFSCRYRSVPAPGWLLDHIRLCKPVRIRTEYSFHFGFLIMSSLKDIMVVVVEPLQSQAYRRALEGQIQASPHPFVKQPSAPPSSPLHNKIEDKAPAKRRRSSRASGSSDQSVSAAPRTTRQQASAGPKTMDFTSEYQAGGGNANQGSSSGSHRHQSRGSEQSGMEVPLKYTPVTGRISRAKKGVPVHHCLVCRPVKVSVVLLWRRKLLT
jgi:hypothetical protein